VLYTFLHAFIGIDNLGSEGMMLSHMMKRVRLAIKLRTTV